MVRLREFTENDFNLLVSWVDSAESLMEFAGTNIKYPLNKLQFFGELEENNWRAFAVENLLNGEVIGHAQIKVLDNSVHLGRIIIASENLRGKGYGKALVRSLLDLGIRKLNKSIATLFVLESNNRAINCYKRAGFTFDNSQTNEIRTKLATFKVLKMVYLAQMQDNYE